MGIHSQQQNLTPAAINTNRALQGFVLINSPGYSSALADDVATGITTQNVANSFTGSTISVTGRRKIYDSYFNAGNGPWIIPLEADHPVQYGNTGLSWTTVPGGGTGYVNTTSETRFYYVMYSMAQSNSGTETPDLYSYTCYLERRSSNSARNLTQFGYQISSGNGQNLANYGSHWAAINGTAIIQLAPGEGFLWVAQTNNSTYAVKVVGSSPAPNLAPPGQTNIQVMDLTNVITNNFTSPDGTRHYTLGVSSTGTLSIGNYPLK